MRPAILLTITASDRRRSCASCARGIRYILV